MKACSSLLCAILFAVCVVKPSQAGVIVEGFEDTSGLVGRGWTMTNNSDPAGAEGWFQGNPGDPGSFDAQAGNPEEYIAANFNSTADVGTISNWLITPRFVFANGDSLT